MNETINIFLLTGYKYMPEKHLQQLAMIFIIFLDFMVFYQIFLPLQVKRCQIITYKHGIYELSHELPNDLRLRIQGNLEMLGKCLKFIE